MFRLCVYQTENEGPPLLCTCFEMYAMSQGFVSVCFSLLDICCLFKLLCCQLVQLMTCERCLFYR